MVPEAVTCLSVVSLTLLMVSSIHSHEAVNPLQHQEPHQHQPMQQMHQSQPSPGEVHAQQEADHHHHQAGRRIDRTSVHDEEHLKEHFDGQIKEEAKLSDEEMQFRYFKVHDYDGNNMLDGIELIKALTHHHTDGKQEQRIPDDELSTMINEILNDNDRNGDGYIDYAEFILSQRGDSS